MSDNLPDDLEAEWQKAQVALDRLWEEAPGAARECIEDAQAELDDAKRRAIRAYEFAGSLQDES